MKVGLAYFISMLVLAVIVAVDYSAAKEAYADSRRVLRESLRRLGQLLGLLVVLGLLVHILSNI